MAKLSDWKAFPKQKYDEWQISLPAENGQRYFLCDDGINIIGEDNRAEVARLIAAAPDLLAALETILSKEKGWDNAMCPLCFAYAYRKAHSDPHKPECPYEIARAAIAKAKGGDAMND